jgi:hypothetical protein
MSAPFHLGAAASFVSPRPRDITPTRTRWRWPPKRDCVQWPMVIPRPTGLHWPLTSPAGAASAGLAQVQAWLSECSPPIELVAGHRERVGSVPPTPPRVGPLSSRPGRQHGAALARRLATYAESGGSPRPIEPTEVSSNCETIPSGQSAGRPIDIREEWLRDVRCPGQCWAREIGDLGAPYRELVADCGCSGRVIRHVRGGGVYAADNNGDKG